MIFIDTADLTLIKKWLGYSFVAGITTNPLILQSAGVTDRFAHLKTINSMLSAHQVLMIQAVGLTVDAMLQDARTIHRLFPSVVIKIPADEIGFTVGSVLMKDNIDVLFTAVYSATQGIFGGAAGGRFIAPYVGRMKDAGIDPWKEIKMMTENFKKNQTPCVILAASLRMPEDIAEALALGCAVTAKPEVLEKCFTNEPTQKAMQSFNEAAGLIPPKS